MDIGTGKNKKQGVLGNYYNQLQGKKSQEPELGYGIGNRKEETDLRMILKGESTEIGNGQV